MNPLSEVGQDKVYSPSHKQTAADPRNVQVQLYLQALFVPLRVDPERARERARDKMHDLQRTQVKKQCLTSVVSSHRYRYSVPYHPGGESDGQ